MRIPFLAQDINVPSSGSGAVHTSFQVPYTTLFSDKTASWTVETRFSNHIQESQVATQRFKVTAYTSKDTIFTEGPATGSVVTQGSPMSLSWNSELLSYFQVSNVISGDGQMKSCSETQIYLVSTSSSGTLHQLLTTTTSSDGKATITIPVDKNIDSSFKNHLEVVNANSAEYTGRSQPFQIVSEADESYDAAVISKLAIQEIQEEEDEEEPNEVMSSVASEAQAHRSLLTTCPSQQPAAVICGTFII